MKLRAKENARLESERKEKVVEEEQAKIQPAEPSYLRPLNKRVSKKSFAEPPPRLLLLQKLKSGRYYSPRLTANTGARSASRERSRTGSIPGYTQTTSRSTGKRSRRSHHIPRVRVQSTSQVVRGRSKSRGRGAWGLATITERARNSSQRRPGRGRSTSARRRGTSRSWMGHVSKSRTSRSYNRRSNYSASLSPRRPIWPAMTALARAAQPSRLKLRGKHQRQQ